MKRWLCILILLIAIPAWGQPRAKPKTAPPPAPAPRAVGLDGTITWSAPGGTWNTGETVTDVDMNEIATEVNACFSTGDATNAGTFTVGTGSTIAVTAGAITPSGSGVVTATNLSTGAIDLTTDFNGTLCSGGTKILQNNAGTWACVNPYWTDAGTVLWPTGSESVGNDATGTNWLITNAGVATFAGTLTASTLTAAPSPIPLLSLDDSDFTTGAAAESIVRGNAVGNNNGRVELGVENGTDNVYKVGVTVCSSTGTARTLLGTGIDADNVSPGIGNCATPTGDGVQVTDAGALTIVNAGTIQATGLTCTGCVTATELATDAVDTAEIKNGAVLTPKLGPIARTRMCEWNIETPAAADDGLFQCYIPATSSITKLVCSSVGASTLVNLYERTTPDTGSTDMLTADVSCDADGAVSGTAPSGWTDFNVAAGRFLALSIGGTPTATLVRVHVEYTVD